MVKSLKQKNKSNDLLPFWYHKDYQKDGIPGISLDKWYRKNKKQTKSNKVIVAVIDSQIDLDHEGLKKSIWINTNEIPDNEIDDDNNGYIDDNKGWSFIGT